tara:strand:- start:1777 stop:3261 length:1485 start_codon:yes stop_codon:yes gene_type:complete
MINGSLFTRKDKNKKMKKIFYITVLSALLGGSLSAQQLPLSSLYNVNKFQHNSAYAGFSDCLEGYLSHRTQWVGVAGAPTTNYLSLHSGVGKNMGLGVNLALDQTDIISKFSGSLSYAYKVKLGMEHNIRFGLSGGIYQITTNVSNAIVDDISDEIVVGGNQSSMAFKNDFSIYYNFKKLELGISIPQILETNAKYDLSSAEGSFSQSRHIVGYLGYDIPVSEKLSLEPSVFYRTANGKQSQLDINAQLNYNKTFFVGAGYRTNAGPLARFGMNLKETFVVAYAYEFTNNSISSYSGGSHEIMLGVTFCKDQAKGNVVKVEPVGEPIVKEEVQQEVVAEIIKEEVKPIVEEPVVEDVKSAPTVEPSTLEDNNVVNDLNAEFNERNSIIRYAINSSDNSVSENEKMIVDKVVEVLKNNPEIKLIVTGHSCDKGSEEINKTFSKKRAQRIANLVTKKGVDSSRVTILSKGESTPLKPNTSEANRAENRRVQLSFSK